MMRKQTGAAFTLVEILIVISIIIILAAMLAGVLLTLQTRAKNEGQGNQIKLILSALDKFKTDFGEYPSVDSGVTIGSYKNSLGTTEDTSSTKSEVSNWADRNSLAYRLCQKNGSGDVGFVDASGNASVTAASFSRASRSTWAGSYLGPTDLPGAQVENNEIRDTWGNALAYCMAPEAFFEAVKGRTLSATTSTVSDMQTAAKNGYLTTVTNYSTSGYYAFYKSGGAPFARPVSTAGSGITSNGFMGPNGYALRNLWSDSELNLPEVWSRGNDCKRIKFQYNSANTAANASSGTGYNLYNGTNSSDYYYDKDNVGGNTAAMKIQ